MPETLKVVEMPDQALIDRYGKYAEEKGIDPVDIKPGPMFMKDHACSTGVFPWSVYTKLIPRKCKRIMEKPIKD